MARAKQPILSIIIPAYNVEEYLERCLSSLEQEIKKIEVIVVNDGSTDGTAAIAKKWAKKYPDNVTAIDKENGGHGSTINAGIKRATGKYVRVLDSDDWLNSETLSEYLNALEKADSDIVLTDYSRKIAKETDGFETVEYSFRQNLKPKKYQIIDYLTLPEDLNAIELFSIHTISIKTEVIKNAWGDGLLEKTFYEDQEWVAKAIMAASSFMYCPVDVYQYYLGRNEQSMNKDKMFQNRKQHERVVLRLVEIAEQADETKKKILTSRIAVVVRTHYWIYFYHPHLKKSERQEYKEFKAKLKKTMPQVLKNIDAKFKMRLFVGRKRQEIYNK